MSESLTALGPLDGRYAARLSSLAKLVSEKALIGYRVRVEIEYLRALSALKGFGPRAFSAREKALLAKLSAVSDAGAARVKIIEATTNHDVKAIEYFLREKLKRTSLRDSLEWIHFGLTSEDVNNIAYALMLRDACGTALIPKMEEIVRTLRARAKTHAGLPMLARTHGQPASPTTFGKELRVFAERLSRELAELKRMTIPAKLNGATGNYNALVAAAPNIHWPSFSARFIRSFNRRGLMALEPNLYTTQIEPHDGYARLFHALSRANTILIGLDRDMWRYISDGWVKQKPKAEEIGSSTMPHKVNPIDFENGEGNLGLANALLSFFSEKLPISRLQRDLSDSTVERSMGVALAHSYLGYDSLLKGLAKIAPDARLMKDALVAHPEVLAEAIQTILRREGVSGAYEKLKDLTRGEATTLSGIRVFVETLSVSEKVKKELLGLTPENYLGLAGMLAKK